MSLPLSKAQTIDIGIARQQVARGVRSRDSIDLLEDARYRLLNALQTTLDIDQLLAIFFNEINSLFAIKGLRYIHEYTNLQLTLGDTDVHSCAYRLITQQDHLGEVAIYRESRFTERELEQLENLMSTLLCPLRNSLKFISAVNASLTDALTGAGNRMALKSAMTREIATARRYQHPLSILIIDIDKFKSINDKHGHSAGDKVLQELVRVMDQVNRNTDQCFRYGGEEFVVILSNTHTRGAGIIGERLRKAIAALRICAEHGPLQVTVSIGAATFCETDTEETLLNRADKAMYAAKNAGGNSMTSA
tara:strand:- start:45259 stop:46176 length:918 start_codon:yes stop_codon:yes gene_type:complete